MEVTRKKQTDECADKQTNQQKILIILNRFLNPNRHLKKKFLNKSFKFWGKEQILQSIHQNIWFPLRMNFCLFG